MLLATGPGGLDLSSDRGKTWHSLSEGNYWSVDFGTAVDVGDVEVTVIGAEVLGDELAVSVTLAGVDDIDGVESFRLVTGDRRLDPIAAPKPGRCIEITVAAQDCVIEFDISASQGTSRVLVLRRGEDQATWRLD